MKRKIVSLTFVSILFFLLVAEFSISLKAFSPENKVSSIHRPYGAEIVEREIILKFRTSLQIGRLGNTATTGIGSIDELNMRFKAEEIKEVISGVYKVSFLDSTDIVSIVREYEGDPNVEYAEPNFAFRTCAVPNDPEYSKQWAHQIIESESAWEMETGSPEVTIAVVDTGIDWSHPDLAANIWKNTDEVADGRDSDGNGYIDDVRGYDFVDTDDPVFQGEDGETRDNDPMDFHGHGTHCAGVVAAVADNGLGIAGVAWNSKIMAVRAGYKAEEGGGYLESEDAAAAIVYAADNGANIISMSWGDYRESSLIREAIQYAFDKGVLLVAAAGNDATSVKHYPAAYEEVIAVAATDKHDNLTSWTNFGNWVELGAPGLDIYSTVWKDSYRHMSGTSMSAPYVAGVAALIWSHFPNMTHNRVRLQLWSAVNDLGDSGYDEYYGFGRVNARKALEETPSNHDLYMLSLDTPPGARPDRKANVKTTIVNHGKNDETHVTLKLLTNGTPVDSISISWLKSGALTTISLTWIPILEGVYNVTVQMTPVADEEEVSNNLLFTSVVVREAKTFRVPEDFATMQDAVDSAIDGIGDTVYVRAGTYRENVVVNKAVSLVGEKRETKILDGWVEIRANNVNVTGFTLSTSNLIGVHLHFVTGCNILNNTLTSSRGGIYLYSSSNNTIARNNITNNNYGLYLRYSSHNLIYHNNFVDNTILQVRVFDSENFWNEDYPTGGNYWSSETNADLYRGSHQNETGSDGVGDNPYEIDEDNKDSYPLMGPFRAFNLKWAGASYRVDTISNSTLSDFHFNAPHKLVSFNVTGPEGTIGFCRVTIPKIVLGDSYTILVDNLPPTTLTITSNGTDYYMYFTYSHPSKRVEIAGVRMEGTLGDANNDGTVDIYDIVTAVLGFGTTPGHPSWNVFADINEDGTIDIFDLILIAENFGRDI